MATLDIGTHATGKPQRSGPAYPFHHAAECVADYTVTLPLECSELTFNLATGHYLLARPSDREVARARVEAGKADRSPQGDFALLKARADGLREEESYPTSLVILPTYGCNLGCSYCYEGKLTKQQYYWSSQEIDTFMTAFDAFIAAERIDPGVSAVTLLGGEVVREEAADRCRSLVGRLSAHGFKDIQIISNGLELAPLAASLVDSGATSFMITIDGTEAVHDKRRPARDRSLSSYRNAVEAVAAVLDAGAKAVVRINADGRNVDNLPDLARELENRGLFGHPLFRAYIHPVSSDFKSSRTFMTEVDLCRAVAGHARREPLMTRFEWDFHGLDLLYRIARGAPLVPRVSYCGATDRQYVFDAKGGVFSCWFGTGKEDFQLGRHSGGEGIVVDREKLAQWQSRSALTHPVCRTCRWATVCGGGCSFKSHFKTDDFRNGNCADFESILSICAPFILKEGLCDPAGRSEESRDIS
ncbi:MAG: radical SAM protein [Litorimonas sp.]